MTSNEAGFVMIFTKLIAHSIVSFHCIVPHETLCAIYGLSHLEDIMRTRIEVVHFIASRVLNKKQLKMLLKDLFSAYGGFLVCIAMGVCPKDL
jgi:hypothetical protein